MKQHFAKLLSRIYLYLPLLLVAFILGSLLTYDSSDPSFNHSTSFVSKNIFLSFGSYFSDLAFQLFGLYPFFLCLVIVIWFFKDKVLKISISYMKLRKLSLLLSVFIITIILSLLPVTESWPFYVDMGGLLGILMLNFLEKSMVSYGFNNVYVYILLFSLSIPFIFFTLGFSTRELRLFFVFIRWLIGKIYILLYLFKTSLYNLANYALGKKHESIEDILNNTNQRKKKIDVNIKREYTKIKIVERETPKYDIIAAGKEEKLKLPLNDIFILPSVSLLAKVKQSKNAYLNQSALEQNAKLLQTVLEDFGVLGNIVKAYPGPVITLYEFEPSPGTKSSRVIGLVDDIARSMSSVSARISVIPGRNVLGIELPNAEREIVYLQELLESEGYKDKRIKLPIALGKDIGGIPFIADLSRMPHLLVAGTTGSGKSVGINAMILSLLYRLTPEECKFIMIDPKMLELSVYDGIPHLLSPVVTDPKKASVALNWVVKEMESRYRAMSKLGTRNIGNYNEKIANVIKTGEKLKYSVQTGFNPETGEPTYETQDIETKKLPFIVVIVDEMADLMLTVGKEIEYSIQRLAQMARAAGIHIIMATQRPSVDVITGVIKANFPTRISFQVTSRIDSRTILGDMGAEQLLGLGDMLYMGSGNKLVRLHAPFVDDEEVVKVVSYLKTQSSPDYIEDILVDEEDNTNSFDTENDGDDLYNNAVAIILRDKKISISYIQRQLKIGYNRAANIVERMEKEGVVSEPNHSGKREILIT